jgi:hypothetical protein
MDNGFVPIFTSDAFDHEPGQADVQSLVWQFPALSGGEQTVSIGSLALLDFPPYYTVESFDLSATLTYSEGPSPTFTRSRNESGQTDTWTLSTPVGAEAYTTPAPLGVGVIDPGYSNPYNGTSTSTATCYVAWNLGTLAVQFVAVIRVFQTWRTTEIGDSGEYYPDFQRFYQHVISLGAPVSGFETGVVAAHPFEFSPGTIYQNNASVGFLPINDAAILALPGYLSYLPAAEDP